MPNFRRYDYLGHWIVAQLKAFRTHADMATEKSNLKMIASLLPLWGTGLSPVKNVPLSFFSISKHF